MSSPTHEEILRQMADRKRNEARWFAKGAPEAAARALARAEVFLAGADALASRDVLLAALRKVRAHTSYVNPTMELLTGLLASIERIADAALAEKDEKRS